MVPGKFDWFLHTMIFYHTRYGLEKQDRKGQNGDIDDSDDDVDVDSGSGGDDDDDTYD